MPETAPLVSVVIPTYNLAAYTAEALESVRAQTLGDYEVVIVDDGSTDNTVEVIQPFLKDSRFKLIEQPNQGTAAARNTAISNARGQWIAFLDCDDLWLPAKLEKQAEVIEANPRAALIFGNGIEFDETGDTGVFYRKPEVFPDGVGLERVLRRNCFWACSVMVRRQDVLDAGMLRVDLPGVDDYDLWLKVLERGGDARGVWEPVARYRKRRDSQGLNKRLMFERLLRVYQDASERIPNPRLKSIARDCVARVSSDLLMTQARQSLGAGDIHGCGKCLRGAWRRYPKRMKPIALLALCAIGRRESAARALARKW